MAGALPGLGHRGPVGCLEPPRVARREPSRRPGPGPSWCCDTSRLTQARIAAALGVSCSAVGRVLARAGLSRLGDLQPSEAVVRHEHAAPGQMLHIDTRKLGRIERPGHRVTGNRRDPVDGAGR